MFIKHTHRTSKSVSDDLLVEGTSIHTHETSNQGHGERDEVKEIQRLSHADTRRIRTWRFIMLTAILATAVSVLISSTRSMDTDAICSQNQQQP